MNEEHHPTPARLLEENFGGSRALTVDQIPTVVDLASQLGILDVTMKYVRYRRPDLEEAIDQALNQR
ncbi:MAG: hypothetical protein ABEJ96_08425 [Thiohalorhabdaceae bacterium]